MEDSNTNSDFLIENQIPMIDENEPKIPLEKEKNSSISHLETVTTPVISNTNIPNTQNTYNDITSEVMDSKMNDMINNNMIEDTIENNYDNFETSIDNTTNNDVDEQIFQANKITIINTDDGVEPFQININNTIESGNDTIQTNISSSNLRSRHSSLSNINTKQINYKRNSSNFLSPDNYSEHSSIPASSPVSTLMHTPFYQTDLCNEGDERADAVVELLKIRPYQDALSIIIHHVVSRRTWGTPLEYKQHLLAKEFHELVCEVPSWVDWTKIRNGQKVFWRYAWPLWISCIGNAMTRGATLPIPSPNDNKTPNQRLLETSQFLLECMYPDSLKPGNFGWSTAVRIRCAHALARLNYRNTLKERINNNEPTPLEENMQNAGIDQKYAPLDSMEEQQYQEMLPVSQADLIRTILYLSLGSVAAMKRGFGIRMEKEEKEDYVLLWRYIAWLCGVDNQNNPLISLREGEVAATQLINTESCMFLDDNAIRFTQAILQAMARLIPLFGYSHFARALTNEMAYRLMGNEVVTNMRLQPKPNEYHRQMVKWFIQWNRLICRVVAKNSFGQSVLCTVNRLVVPKVVWFANSGKWVDYSRGVSGNNKHRTAEEGERSSQSSPYRSESNSPYKSEYSSPSISETSNYNRNVRRSQIRSMDSTLVNEFIDHSVDFSMNETNSEIDSQNNDSILEDEEWVQKPLGNNLSKIKRNSFKRNSHVRPQSWSNDYSSRYSFEITESDSVSQRRYSAQPYYDSRDSDSLSKNGKGIPYPTHWFENFARLNMWAVVPAMSVAMAAYCVVLVYID
ncbi:hypothetical protein BCR36DRAFT_365631 [Piromyces finnis]|uniref:ER-bound oxygenase mpaB/mpaB'/Rubber oxygenase catalytic domain-containing protein n=1 Tax=Piromyces finnis TaxID=1754191 RepID=A0A1Y1VNQ7_9FUNG|nr:hypothetical protein BCR36DRAFT_365631 [Piromyces finnis]|eukprot:ORX61047.1 hypothetical protein BCR36DRAFT_365631 [Piromyces finnis]